VRQGTFSGESDTVSVTISGGGKTQTIPVILKKRTILLGETKYFYVAAVEHSRLLQIKEVPSTDLPDDANLNFNWGDDAVSIVPAGAKAGKRLGVYWETEKPIAGGTGNLPQGLIRVVGRYWHADSVYVVRLTARDVRGWPISLTMEVESPNKLGNDYGPLPGGGRRMSVDDVLGQQYNLDSVIISYAGQYGTPPQFIKSQIQEESHFDPSYLYEPFEDLKRQSSRADSTRIYSNQYRILSSEDIGAPLLPTTHNNVHNVLGKTSYPGFGGSIWQYYDRYKKNLYARTNSGGIVMYESLNKVWRDSLFNPIKDSLVYNEHMTDASAKEAAEEQTIPYLPICVMPIGVVQ
jgi:hypothetical protein